MRLKEGTWKGNGMRAVGARETAGSACCASFLRVRKVCSVSSHSTIKPIEAHGDAAPAGQFGVQGNQIAQSCQRSDLLNSIKKNLLGRTASLMHRNIAKETLIFYTGFETKNPNSLKAQSPIRNGMTLI